MEGIRYQLIHGKEGHKSYLFGEVRSHGWWWFYLACLAFKVTPAAQVLAVLRLGLGPWSRPNVRALLVDAALLAYPAILFSVLSRGNTQNGIKYLLPAFPFVFVWLARIALDVRALWGRAGLALVGALLLWGALDSALRVPHSLMYFNAWAGGPEGGTRYLVHGDDWCQDQKRLGQWQRAQGVRSLYYTRCAGRHERWGIEGRPPPCTPTPGVYALHAIEAHRPDWTPERCLDWLTVEPPDERIGHSIYIYRVDAARLARLAQQKGAPAFWMR